MMIMEINGKKYNLIEDSDLNKLRAALKTEDLDMFDKFLKELK